MERKEILLKLEDIIRDVLDNNSLIIDENTTAEDIEEWDSLTNVQIVVEMQKVFGKKFSAKDILLWECVSDMIDSIMK